MYDTLRFFLDSLECFITFVVYVTEQEALDMHSRSIRLQTYLINMNGEPFRWSVADTSFLFMPYWYLAHYHRSVQPSHWVRGAFHGRLSGDCCSCVSCRWHWSGTLLLSVALMSLLCAAFFLVFVVAFRLSRFSLTFSSLLIKGDNIGNICHLPSCCAYPFVVPFFLLRKCQ